jgi:hypothetical protein
MTWRVAALGLAAVLLLSASALPDASASASSLRMSVARLRERAVSMAGLPLAQLPSGVLALCGAGVVVALGASNLLIAGRMHALHGTHQRVLANSLDDALNRRRMETLSRLAHEQDVEGLAAQLIADALRQPVMLAQGQLVTDAEPAPYFSVTDRFGVRYFFTTNPGLFRRVRLLRRTDPSRNVSALSASARADVLAAWDALTRLRGFTHVAMPRGADWHVIRYVPLRGRSSLRMWLRIWRDARRIRQQPQTAQARHDDIPASVVLESGLAALPEPVHTTATGGLA